MIELNHIRRGSGEPLLLIHSLGGSLVMWEPVLDRLAEQREVVAVDMPGFGESPPLPEGTEPSPANLAGAVMDFYEALGIGRKPGVSGISLGGWTSIECGRLGRASAVVAFCPAGFWRDPYVPGRNLARSAAKLLSPLAPLLVRSAGVRHRVLSGNMRHGERTTPAQALALVRGYARAVAYDDANRLMCGGVVADLAELEVPVTLAWAEFDRVVRNRPLKPGILPDNVRQVALQGCGHVPTWDDPELVTRVILEGTSLRRDNLETIGER